MAERRDEGVLIDCDTCTVRGEACADCVVTVMLGLPGPVVTVDPDERKALDVLARCGLVPRLRMAGPDPEGRRRREAG